MHVLAAFLLLLSLSAPSASPAPGARTLRLIELKGNARILATDVPVRKGRVYLFHRYPDGVYMSVAAEDVLGIAATTAPAAQEDNDTVALGPTGEGISNGPSVPANFGSGAPSATYDQGYPGYYGDCFGCWGPPVRPPHAGTPPPALVGPNGFPLVPGSPPPNPIGPNGFPIIAPPPAAPRPSPR
jgi:hypothetical protein